MPSITSRRRGRRESSPASSTEETVESSPGQSTKPLSPRSNSSNNSLKSSASKLSRMRSRTSKKAGGGGGVADDPSSSGKEERPGTPDENREPSPSPSMKKRRSLKKRLGLSSSGTSKARSKPDRATASSTPTLPPTKAATVAMAIEGQGAEKESTTKPAKQHTVTWNLSNDSSMSITSKIKRSSKKQPYVPLHLRMRELKEEKTKTAQSSLPPLDPNSKKSRDTTQVVPKRKTKKEPKKKEEVKSKEPIKKEEDEGPIEKVEEVVYISPITVPSALSWASNDANCNIMTSVADMLPKIDGLCSGVVESKCSKEATVGAEAELIDIAVKEVNNDDTNKTSLKGEKPKEESKMGDDAKSKMSEVAKTSSFWSNLCVASEAFEYLLPSRDNVCSLQEKSPWEGTTRDGSTSAGITGVYEKIGSSPHNTVPFTNSWPLTAANANTKAVTARAEREKQEAVSGAVAMVTAAAEAGQRLALDKSKELANKELQRVISKSEVKCRSYMDHLELMETKFKKESQKNEALSARLEELKLQQQQQQQQLLQEHYSCQQAKLEVEEVHRAKAEVEAKYTRLESILEAGDEENRDLKSQIIQMKQLISEKTAQAEEDKEEIKRIKAQAEEDILARTEELKASEARFLRASEENSDLKTQIAHLTQEIQSALARQQQLNEEVQRVKEQAVSERLAQKEEFQEQLLRANQQNGELKEQVAKLTKDIGIIQMNAQKTIDAQNAKLEEMERAIECLKMDAKKCKSSNKDTIEGTSLAGVSTLSTHASLFDMKNSPPTGLPLPESNSLLASTASSTSIVMVESEKVAWFRKLMSSSNSEEDHTGLTPPASTMSKSLGLKKSTSDNVGAPQSCSKGGAPDSSGGTAAKSRSLPNSPSSKTSSTKSSHSRTSDKFTSPGFVVGSISRKGTPNSTESPGISTLTENTKEEQSSCHSLNDEIGADEDVNIDPISSHESAIGESAESTDAAFPANSKEEACGIPSKSMSEEASEISKKPSSWSQNSTDINGSYSSCYNGTFDYSKKNTWTSESGSGPVPHGKSESTYSGTLTEANDSQKNSSNDFSASMEWNNTNSLSAVDSVNATHTESLESVENMSELDFEEESSTSSSKAPSEKATSVKAAPCNMASSGKEPSEKGGWFTRAFASFASK